MKRPRGQHLSSGAYPLPGNHEPAEGRSLQKARMVLRRSRIKMTKGFRTKAALASQALRCEEFPIVSSGAEWRFKLKPSDLVT